MNNKLRRISILIVFTCSAFLLSLVADKRSYQTECVSLETDGYVTIKIWDTKKGAKYNPDQARQDAIRALLYSGIAGTNGCTTQPPLLSNLDDQNKFKNIERSFWSKKGKWVNFTRNSATETTIPKIIADKNNLGQGET